MAKAQHEVKLVGRLADGSIAKTHQANEVVGFSDEANNIKLWPVPDDMLLSGDFFLQTSKGRYILKKHDSLNLFQGKVNGCKIHFTKKKVIAKLIYWA